jgi:hypothetical protein
MIFESTMFARLFVLRASRVMHVRLGLWHAGTASGHTGHTARMALCVRDEASNYGATYQHGWSTTPSFANGVLEEHGSPRAPMNFHC